MCALSPRSAIDVTNLLWLAEIGIHSACSDYGTMYTDQQTVQRDLEGVDIRCLAKLSWELLHGVMD